MSTSTTHNIISLNDYLSKHKANDGDPITHTRIGDKELNIYGGKYNIPSSDLTTFYRVYYESIFVKGQKEYLTEKQQVSGPIAIDLDFHYDYDVTSRQHSPDTINDIIYLYLTELKKLLVFDHNVPFNIFVMERDHVYRLEDKTKTKDGIHIIIGLNMHHAMQMMLRNMVISKINGDGGINETLGLPLKNSIELVFDDGISQGTTNWQMYGSQKPGRNPYKLSYHIVCKMDTTDNEFSTESQNIHTFELSKNLSMLSVQNTDIPNFQIDSSIQSEYDASVSKYENKKTSKKYTGAKHNINVLFNDEDTNIELSDIKNAQILETVLQSLFSNLKTNEQFIKETHEYTQILPEKYYQPGSHSLNTQVAFALKHTDERLFLSWVALRSKACDFDYNSIPYLYTRWKTFGKKDNGITKRSIMYWAKQDAFEAYEKVKQNTTDYYVESTLQDTPGDYDFALVLHSMYKDKYLCSSIGHKKWHRFKDHRWISDEGQSLRLAISEDMHAVFSKKLDYYLGSMHHTDTNTDVHDKTARIVRKISEILTKLRKTNDKNNIMREAMEIFFDGEFNKNVDSNPYLLCFTNGVIDFKNKVFRSGYPQDYITKSTHHSYVEYSYQNTREITDQINDYMEKTFPQVNLRNYMWDHLASVLIGVKLEQVFNIYCGSGSNGKSILTDLMSQALGEYKGTVPVTLVTDKRTNIGAASPEVMQLKGVRYAVMQEPSKDAVINEGIMKELTGGDPLLGRALYSDSEIFMPQFSLAVCLNALFRIKSNDDGTWRRMKLVNFMSKFISEGETHTDDTQYVFPKDKTLKEKLPVWAPVFISMLVKRAFETNGRVQDCTEVLSASNKYRQSQDAITGFINEKIISTPGKTIGKQNLNQAFKDWHQLNYGSDKIPKLMELEEIMDKRFKSTKTKPKKWLDVSISMDEDKTDDIDEL